MWDLPGPGIELMSPALANRFFTTKALGKPLCHILDSTYKWFCLSLSDLLIISSSIHVAPNGIISFFLYLRSLVGCSPWSRWGSDTAERFPFHFSLSCIGEGNGNPLQCSCLENPRDAGAWWAAICGVAQSQIRLKWLSSSSSKWYNSVHIVICRGTNKKITQNYNKAT